MPTNRKEHLRYRYGICLKDDCPKCKSKEVQQIPARKDFVCEECKKPLRECPPPKSFWDKYGKPIIGAGVALIAAAAIILYICLPDDKTIDPDPKGGDPTTGVTDTDTTSVDEPVDTTVFVKDSIAPLPGQPDTVTDGEKKEPGGEGSTPIPMPRVSFGTYSGPANGLDGEIKVTQRYNLDLRNAANESIELLPGDVITRTKFKNGELVGGYWKRGSESRVFHR